MAHGDEADGGTRQCVHHRKIFLAGNAEDDGNALVFQALDEELCCIHEKPPNFLGKMKEGRDGHRVRLLPCRQSILTYRKPEINHFQSVNGTYFAPVSEASASGESSTCAPIFPALTQMASKSWAVSSMKVGSAFFMPMGLQPPWI